MRTFCLVTKPIKIGALLSASKEARTTTGRHSFPVAKELSDTKAQEPNILVLSNLRE